jgi:hypothetical protein
MSRFFSSKALKYRRLEGREIVDDRPCPHCGYNLRGLPEGRSCPECGGDPTSGSSEESYVSSAGVTRHPLVDIFTTAPEEERGHWRIGLSMAAGCVAAAAAGRIVVFLVSVPGGGALIAKIYLGLAILLSIAWIVASACMLPTRLAHVWPWMASWRGFVLATQWLWVIGYGAAVFHRFGSFSGGVASLLLTMEVIAWLVAGVGALVFVFLMRHVAEEAELEPAASRLNLALWLLPIAAPLVIVTTLLFPASMGSLPRSPWGLVSLYLVVPPAIMLAAWAWLMILLALGFWQMQRHTYWVRRLAVEAEGRDERIVEKRRQLERQAGGQVRALPEHEDEGDIAPEEAKP